MTTQRIATWDDVDINAMRQSAGEAGDMEMVAICDRAEDGDIEAQDKCVRVLQATLDAE